MSIKVVIQNNTIKLPMDIPDGTEAEVVLQSGEVSHDLKSANSFFDTVRELIGSVEGPVDWAAEHDHYIHGTPKRNSE